MSRTWHRCSSAQFRKTTSPQKPVGIPRGKREHEANVSISSAESYRKIFRLLYIFIFLRLFPNSDSSLGPATETLPHNRERNRQTHITTAPERDGTIRRRNRDHRDSLLPCQYYGDVIASGVGPACTRFALPLGCKLATIG